MSSPYQKYTQKLLGCCPGISHTDTETIYRYSFDGLKISFLPEVVIIPDTENEIKPVLEIANEGKVPVTVRGSGSTLTGAATPVKGGWVIDLSRLNQIHIDPLHRMANVGCGAVVRDIQEAAFAQNLFYPPDPSSDKWCTIGGNIACNAGGLRCVKYGVTRDYIVSLRGYLPTGEFVEWAKPVRKFAVAYNIRDLWIGSEGTLGIITSATLKLIPKPTHKRTLLCGFHSERRALESILSLLSGGVTPSIMEFIDSLSVQGAEQTNDKSFFEDLPNPCVILIELDGDQAQVDRDYDKVTVWAQQHADTVRLAATDEEAESLWEVRRTCSSAMFRLGNSKLNEDVVVPLVQMPKLIEYIELLRKEYLVPVAVFGHAGDGNLHVNIMYNSADEEMAEKAQACLYRLMEKVVVLNGAISGEHGIGLAKSKFLDLQYQPAQIDLLKRLKAVFDPNGIMNPGKIFDSFSPWDYPRVSHQFPWDKKKR
jgi:glycolate oxidase